MDELNKIITREQEYNRNFHKVHNDWRKNIFSNRQGYSNQYYKGTNRGGFVPRRNHRTGRNYGRSKAKNPKKDRNSPIEEGSEEFMNKKIKQTSAIIMRHLLSPEDSVIPINKSITVESQLDDTETDSKTKSKRKRKESSNEPECSYSSKTKKPSTYNIEAIHDKIMWHLSNLNEGRKKNLISNTTSVYDDAINDILKQKRLELSRALRSVYLKSSDVSESSDWINSIIPDMGIKIEELPVEVLEELRNSLSNLENFEDFANLTEPNAPNVDRIGANKNNAANDNVIPEIEQEVVEIFQSDVLIGTQSVYSTQTFTDCNYTDAITIDHHHNVRKSPSRFGAGTSSTQLDPGTCSIGPEEGAGTSSYPGTCSNGFNGETCSTDLGAGTSSAQLDPGPSSVGLDPATSSQLDPGTSSVGLNAGTCSSGLGAGTASTQVDPGTCTTWFDSGQRREEIESPITVSDGSENDLDRQMEGVSKNHTSIGIENDVLSFFKKHFRREPRTYNHAITRMFLVDKCITKLTEYRQNIFTIIRNKQHRRNAKEKAVKKPGKKTYKKKKNKKKKSRLATQAATLSGQTQQAEVVNLDCINQTSLAAQVQMQQAESINFDCVKEDSIDIDEVCLKKESAVVDVVPQECSTKDAFLEFNDLKEKVLVLKVCKDKLMAATESGKIYFYNLTTGAKEEILQASELPITSLVFKTVEDCKPYLFVGSCESSLKVYNLYSTRLLHSFVLEDSVQCMDEQWGYLFLGCLRGTIFRYSIKKEHLEYQEQFSSDPVLVLKATLEGARKVLLIGSRDSPVIVRDAMSGLLLRKLNIIYPTVFSMVMHQHFVICGTKAFDILMFNFHNGNLEHTFKATTAKGVACMKVVGKCLFASCYNGNIYVFNLETKTLVDKMTGPGGVIISMEVLTNQVIVGTLSFKIASIPITSSVLSQMS